MLYFITGNKNKFAEMKTMLPRLKQLDIDLPEIQDIDARNIIRAKLKEALHHHTGKMNYPAASRGEKSSFIVEDTSLYLDCLHGLPGPLIKWFMETMGNNGLYDIAKRFKNFGAETKTIIGYAENRKDIHFFEGSLRGTIVKPTAASNFGWDPIFQPHGFKKSFAKMNREEKNQISMRRIAIEKLKKFLKTPA